MAQGENKKNLTNRNLQVPYTLSLSDSLLVEFKNYNLYLITIYFIPLKGKLYLRLFTTYYSRDRKDYVKSKLQMTFGNY
jgi:hypothetical protein